MLSLQTLLKVPQALENKPFNLAKVSQDSGYQLPEKSPCIEDE